MILAHRSLEKKQVAGLKNCVEKFVARLQRLEYMQSLSTELFLQFRYASGPGSNEDDEIGEFERLARDGYIPLTLAAGKIRYGSDDDDFPLGPRRTQKR